MPTVTFADLFDALHGHFTEWWAAQSPITIDTVTYPKPAVRAENGGWRPAPGDPYVELSVLEVSRVNTGSADYPVKEWRGILQVDVWLPENRGAGLFPRYADWVEQCWQAAAGALDGIRFYDTHGPRPLPPGGGVVGKHVDTNCLWIAG